MAEFISKSNTQKPKKEVQTKVCKKCATQKPLSDFAANRNWLKETKRDAWCKDCLKRTTTKREIKEYFWYNNREWNEPAWQEAEMKASKTLANNTAYNKSAFETQKKIRERIACQNLQASISFIYVFEPHTDENGDMLDFNDGESGIDNIVQEESLIYSKEFNGKFTKEDLEYLETYYSRLEEDFNFDNESLRDYARKVCKASLASDKAQADFAAGKIAYSDVKEAMNIFDMLSKSANFAACRRKTGESSGLTCWAETTFKLESSGIPIETSVEFPPDDIDKTIEELRHITKALGLDSI